MFTTTKKWIIVNTMLTQKQEELLYELATRFSERVSEYDIYKWLAQFKPEHYDYALDVLLKLDFFTTDDIYTQFEIYFPQIVERINNYYKFLKLHAQNIIDKNEHLGEVAIAKRQLKDLLRNNPIFITGIGSYGKSGAAMIYYATHTPYYRANSVQFVIIDNLNRLGLKNAFDIAKDHTLIKSKNLILQIILVDDIIGSGQSLVKYIKMQLEPQMKSLGISFCIHVFSLIALSDGIKHVKDQIKTCKLFFYGNVVEKSFEHKSRVFGYKIKRDKVREMCEQYGKGLYNSGRPSYDDNPLGHQNSQALVVFPHSTPNNTLPIIWSNQNSWFPLFPRSTGKRLNKAKKIREEMGIWTSVANRLGLNNYLLSKNIYDPENLQMLCTIKLIHEGKSLKYIMSELGIFESDLYEILKKGQEKV